MRILIDIRLLARSGTTGIPGYTQNLVDTLIKEHPEHQYVLFYNAFRKQRALPSAWVHAPHVTVINRRVPNRLLSLALRCTGAPTVERLAKEAGASDVIWSPHLDLLTTSKTPHVVTVHDLSFLHYPTFFSRKYHLWSWLQRQAEQARRASRIIAVSEFTKHDLIGTLGIPPEKISVVRSGILPDFKPLAPDTPALREYQAKANLKRSFILHLGSLEPRKNLPALITAFNELKQDRRFGQYELVLAGHDGYQANKIRKLARQSPAHEDIHFLGAVTDTDRILLYNLARVVVFPSFFEGFGFPPLEAQACGIPVVASNRTSLPEILSSSATLVDPWRTHELARAISGIETNAKMREHIIAAGIKNAAAFTWTRAAQETLDALKLAHQHITHA